VATKALGVVLPRRIELHERFGGVGVGRFLEHFHRLGVAIAADLAPREGIVGVLHADQSQPGERGGFEFLLIINE
jgi:hypothetical protein